MFLRGQPHLVSLIGFLALAGSAAELTVSSRVSSDFEGNQALCKAYLCEERVPLAFAYARQLKDTKASLQLASKILADSLVRDPASAWRWVDLGQALAQAGSLDQASYCMAKALELGGNSADVVMATGDFRLHYGDRGQGLRYLARTLQLTPEFNEVAFSYFEARGVSIDEALKYGMPEEKLPARAYLRHLVQRNNISGAAKVWEWMNDRGFIDEKTATEYTGFLFGQKRFEQAAAAWASQAGKHSAGYRRTEYLFNGDFANEPVAGAIFDWKITPLDHVKVSRDCEFQPGSCLLRIQFDGSANIDFNGVSQTAVLPPGKYRFRASVRAANITTDQGLVFQIADGEAPVRLSLESGPLRKTPDWQDVEIAFAVTPATRLIEVSARRHPSLRFDNKISGTVWIRQVSVARAQ